MVKKVNNINTVNIRMWRKCK